MHEDPQQDIGRRVRAARVAAGLTGAASVLPGLLEELNGAVSDKSRNGGGSEPFKWMGGGMATILLSASVIIILNGISGG
ncbi:hypothetical protein ACIQJ4_35860 [Streptomyces filamentosus]|uniref:hypothetical protein n=1 Tax=Streptomyces filamentosus TaxID=67294 RepID=UPI00382D2BC2